MKEKKIKPWFKNKSDKYRKKYHDAESEEDIKEVEMAKEKIINDPDFCIFFSTVLISFSFGLYLQSIVNELVDYIWGFIIPAIILLGLLVRQKKSNKKKNEHKKSPRTEERRGSQTRIIY